MNQFEKIKIIINNVYGGSMNLFAQSIIIIRIVIMFDKSFDLVVRLLLFAFGYGTMFVDFDAMSLIQKIELFLRYFIRLY